MADNEDIINNEEENVQQSYENPWQDEILKAQQDLEQQEKLDKERQEKLTKGREYWIGANMFANALSNIINVNGTVNGAPAMQMPDMNTSYMDVWQKSDEIRKANYQRMKDHYDKLRLAAKQDEARYNLRMDERKYAAQVKQQAEDKAKAEKEREREERIANIMATRPGWTREDAMEYMNNKNYVPESEIQKTIDDVYEKYKGNGITREQAEAYVRRGVKATAIEDYDAEKAANAFRQRENIKQDVKYFRTGTGKDSNNLYVGDDIVITGKDKSDKKKNLGVVAALVRTKLEEMFPEITDLDIANEKDESKMEQLKQMKAAYNSFNEMNKKTDWKNLDDNDINYYIKKYGLLDDDDFMFQMRRLSKNGSSSAAPVAPQTKKKQGKPVSERVGGVMSTIKGNSTSGASEKPSIDY